MRLPQKSSAHVFSAIVEEVDATLNRVHAKKKKTKHVAELNYSTLIMSFV